jgi:pimeloyl-ACP methyl ester carboxylesterase
MPASRLARISTTVRFALLRAGFRVLGRLAPRWAAARAFLLYGTPARRPPRPPTVAGLTASAGHAQLGTRRVAFWQWGPKSDQKDHGGQNDPPAILLAHGWDGHAGQMRGFVAPLVAAGYRVVAFDQPAHGCSGGQRTHLLDFRDAMLAVAVAVGPVTAVIAHSLGATSTVLALDRGLGARSVVLIAPPLDPGEYVDAFAAALALPAPVATGVKQHVRDLLRADLGDVTPAALARRMTAAALVIHDTQDQAVPVAYGRTLAEAWPGAGFHAVTGLGHNRVLRDADVIARACAFATPGHAAAAAR